MVKELWIDFGVNKHHQYVSTCGIEKALGKEKAEALPFFMPLQDVIPFRLLIEQEKRKLGKLGKFYLL